MIESDLKEQVSVRTKAAFKDGPYGKLCLASLNAFPEVMELSELTPISLMAA